MKKTILTFIFLMMAVTSFAVPLRSINYVWDVTTITLNSEAKRVTNTSDGVLWIQAQGNDCFIAFNATANHSSILITDTGDIDFWPAAIKNGDYFTVFCDDAATINYVVNK